MGECWKHLQASLFETAEITVSKTELEKPESDVCESTSLLARELLKKKEVAVKIKSAGNVSTALIPLLVEYPDGAVGRGT